MIKEKYITPSRSIHELPNGMAYYNHEGTHYRVFNSYNDALDFATIGSKNIKVFADFESEEKLDRFLTGKSIVDDEEIKSTIEKTGDNKLKRKIR
ncbi:MAG: hypothetical protein M0R46_10060 [Candidatus Muirbacterium halophilum]|nr:hypothetical protein [Candidatus Muirbacterium halophilum]